MENKIEKITKELIKLIGVDADIDTRVDKKEKSLFLDITVDSSVTGLLIGHKGKNLFALQVIIGLSARDDLEDYRLNLDVNGWREKENQRLIELAEKTVEKAVETGESQNLYNLSPSQRRIIHMHLSEKKEITTESSGEGNERFLIISPK